MENIGLLTFTIFAAWTLAFAPLRRAVFARDLSDWIIDVTSLLIHFAGLPALQGGLSFWILNRYFPAWRASLASPAWLSVALYLLLDYLWYWNHRFFHAQTPLWNLHKTHHSAEHLDVLMTARNSLFSHFAMVYFWFIGMAVYVLEDSTLFLAMATFGGVVNFWGHTSFRFKTGGLADRLLGHFLVTPQDHGWHHSRENPSCNYGTVFNIWDRLHGTYFKPAHFPTSFGEPGRKDVWSQLVWPYSSTR